jgi:hypothetical protein
MEVIEKKFQIINVGVNLMSDDYRKWLTEKGYELQEVKTGPNGEIYGYTYKLKEDVKQ